MRLEPESKSVILQGFQRAVCTGTSSKPLDIFSSLLLNQNDLLSIDPDLYELLLIYLLRQTKIQIENKK